VVRQALSVSNAEAAAAAVVATAAAALLESKVG